LPISKWLLPIHISGVFAVVGFTEESERAIGRTLSMRLVPS
jgi:hypothetical protein